MKLHLAHLLACLACAPASRAAPPLLLLSPATDIADPARDPAWDALFARLAPRQNEQSFFEERRTFPFRRRPLLLTGEIRIAPGRGFSLHYLTPEPRILIVDRQGVLLRDERGRDLPVPADGRAQNAIAALVGVLRFDPGQLRRDFQVHGIRTGSAWTIAFVPRDPSLAEGMAAVIISGRDDTLANVELLVSPKQHVDIRVYGTRKNVLFDRATLARYFR